MIRVSANVNDASRGFLILSKARVITWTWSYSEIKIDFIIVSLLFWLNGHLLNFACKATRREQRTPNNFGLKFFHFNFEHTIADFSYSVVFIVAITFIDTDILQLVG